MVSRWHYLVAVVVLVLGFAGTAHATPVFLSPINISDAGQDAIESQVAVDPSGNVHAVWTRSDGTNFRIQYSTRTPSGNWSAPVHLSDPGQTASEAQLDIDPSGNILAVWSRNDGTNSRIQAAYKPSAGSFGAPVTVSDPGFDATGPRVDLDDTGKAIVAWSRFDGSFLRVQASTRSAGTGGTFQNEVTLSEGGENGFDIDVAAGPNVDANGVISWTRSDGTNLRIQSSRRRDVTGFPRPKGAGPFRAALVLAYNQCNPPGNRVHAAPLAHPACNPPTRSSSTLTIGTPDAGSGTANSVSSVRWKVTNGIGSTEANEADVVAVVNVNDVKNHPALTDYTGRIGIRTNLKMTDNRNAPEQPEPGTTQSLPLEFAVQCVATGTTAGGTCSSTTSLNAILPGAVVEVKRAIWEMGQITVRDAGPNGTGFASCPPTCGDGDETTFMRQGIFIP